MERHLERHLRKDIKHIIGMQSLLEQYDRENKYLNKQVFELLNENTRLRMDKVKVNIINDMLKNQKKQKTPPRVSIINEIVENNRNGAKKEEKRENEGKLQRNSSKNIIEKFKIESDTQVIQKEVIKKDEAVQTNEASTLKLEFSPKEKIQQDYPFSFRNTTPQKIGFESKEASSQQIISRLELKFNESQMEIAKLSNQDSVSLAISGQKLSNTQSIQDKLVPSASSILINHQNTIKRQSSLGAHMKRSHAIKETPKIMARSSSKGPIALSASEKKIEKRESEPKIRSFGSVEKRKKFLQVTSQTPTKIIIIKEREGCC